jgi:hypothetical protein
MAKRHKAKPQERTREFSRGSVVQTAVPKYKHGDYLRVELPFGTADAPMSFWICADHCMERQAIVVGIIDTETPWWFGNALSRGAKLAVSYTCVRECRPAL